jgi:hypothetical protein
MDREEIQRVLDLERGKILKESLKIVDKLAENELGDIDNPSIDDFDYEELQDLILKARKLKKNRLWKLT